MKQVTAFKYKQEKELEGFKRRPPAVIGLTVTLAAFFPNIAFLE